MYSPFNERICKQCPFKGKVYKTKVGIFEIEYIDCQRDNKDSQENFIRTNKEESLLLWIRGSEFLHCLYAYNVTVTDNTKNSVKK